MTSQMTGLPGIVSDPVRWMTLGDEILEVHLACCRTVDAVVLGGGTYQGLAQYWPEAEGSRSPCWFIP